MGEWRYSSTILNLGTRCEWSTLRPCRFTSEKTDPIPIREETGRALRADLDVVKKRHVLPLPGINPLVRPARSLVAIPIEQTLLTSEVI
jgi:hypothetical protein